MSSSIHDYYDVRDRLGAALRLDLLGPVGGEEEVLKDDAPVTMYPVGVLFPQEPSEDVRNNGDGFEADGDDSPALVRGGDGEEAAVERGVSLANVRRPSSMGITFVVDPTLSERIVLYTTAAVYRPEDAEGNPVTAARIEARSTEEQRERWRRVPLDLPDVEVDVTTAAVVRQSLVEGLELRVLVRPGGEHGTVTVTATLINTRTVGPRELKDAACYYQPVLRVRALAPDVAPFVERRTSSGSHDRELMLSRLLHRHAPGFATGHGCAAVWDRTPPPIGARNTGPAVVAEVRTEFVPTHEVLLTDSNQDVPVEALSMRGLGTADAGTVTGALDALLEGYREWIDERRAEAESLAGTEYGIAAQEQIEACETALARMRTGVTLLSDPDRPHVMRAFQLANRAMAEQRARTSWVKDEKPAGGPDESKQYWRPFQICFLLLCLQGIVEDGHPDRGIADLLWFPTGGGKTEAYLGLIAFTTFLRRLRDPERGGGVTVLMRYTLRLLTLQQFERATALICAMELTRSRHEDELGEAGISIGMWVGKSATPNDLATAGEKLTTLRAGGRSLDTENPVQLQVCPWCGSRLDASDYEVAPEYARMYVRCPDADCAFHRGDGLPVHLVDESVYAAHPTLIIATVDKFASMPWRERTAALFNRDLEGTRPPELIVQDELHLISGPLGTLTGLYETAVDILANRPKVIASTATIRRADEQGLHLFDREVRQFPPAGLDSRDSWFAVEAAPGDKATRRYIGLLTSSTSQSTLLIRTYATLLHQIQLGDVDDEVRDAYWTLVGYFNSLRLLSAAELQVLDDVQDRMEQLAARDGIEKPRRPEAVTELSSRASASDIPRRLKDIERRFPAPEATDVLLATNMISVGVDIDRLGLMAVMGQPQTTAEYIQATSRVGRRHPGLVAVMLNSTRSRDRSHYESFQHFHSALYREVESTSVTPFSARARDRGLHAVIVALARLMIPGAGNNAAAARIEDFVDELDGTVRDALLERVARVAPWEHEATGAAFDEFVDWWRDAAAEDPNLLYEAHARSGRRALLSSFDNDLPEGATGWPTLWSLRDVDASSPFFLEKR
ncbi:helicase-related protein [Kitasatospora sp. YST-16]|uniref:helicase-related protein n=1 Tax=Kitasatospora sp. YST-16 TaxID=2998080 RepID=UPI00228387D2|nr:helicase-related protein [Kitasatospora sp. YST-16]WAL72565.1 helicase-related protein [Kitasatospora sp. YST-16]WNW38613.1 helicase-related protein [Streptomyces sp. Li-HN-5-13]